MEKRTRKLLRRGGPHGAGVFVRVPQRQLTEEARLRMADGYAIFSELVEEYNERQFFKRYNT